MDRIGWNDGTKILGLGNVVSTTSVTVRGTNPGTIVTASISNPILYIIESRRDRRKKR